MEDSRNRKCRWRNSYAVWWMKSFEDAINENIFRDKKFNFATNNASSFDNDYKKVANDNGESEYHSLGAEPEMVLRRHCRLYLLSTSTMTMLWRNV